MPQLFDVVTVGSVIRDVTLFTNQGQVFKTPNNLTAQRVIGFEYGAKVNVSNAHFGCGGGAANAAVTFHRLGLRAAVISRVGADAEGLELRRSLERQGVACGLVQLDRTQHTALSAIVASSRGEHDHVVFVHRGAADGLRLTPAAVGRIRPRWLYVTAMCGPFWQANLRQIFLLAEKTGAKVAWNPGGEQLSAGRRVLERWLRQTAVLQLNKDEAIELALSGIKLGKRNPSFLNKPLYLLNILSEWGPKCVVITDGEHGAYALSGGKVFRQKSLRRKVVDTTGVGDAFGAAFVTGFHLSHGALDLALRWGVLNAASVLTKVGAQQGIMTRGELLTQLKRTR